MKTISKNLSDEFSKGNFSSAFAHFDEDIQWLIIGATVIKGRSAVEAYCNKMSAEMSGASFRNVNQFTGEDFITVEGHCKYLSETNAPGEVQYCDVYRFREDKITEIRSYCIEINVHEEHVSPASSNTLELER